MQDSSAIVLEKFGSLQDTLGRLFKDMNGEIRQVGGGIEAWSETNKLLMGSTQELLKLIVGNSQEVQRLGRSCERELILQEDLQGQMQRLANSIAGLSDLWSEWEGEESLGDQLRSLSAQIGRLEESLMKVSIAWSSESWLLKEEEDEAEGQKGALAARSSPAPSPMVEAIAVAVVSHLLSAVSDRNQAQTSKPPSVTSSAGSAKAQTPGEGKSASGWSFAPLLEQPWALAGGAIAAMLVGVCGVGAGWAWAKVAEPALAAGAPRRLTEAEVLALAWAKSPEGQQAQSIHQWNAGKLEGLDCLNEAKSLGVVLEVDGRSAQSGFCALWVVPPGEREFSEKK